MLDRDADWMRVAIETALVGVAAGQSPYGACVVRGDMLVARAHNTVLRDSDPSAHAEVNALRAAGAALGDIDLSACTVYSTCEPCTMCFACCHWAHVGRIVYGATIADSAAIGFGELHYTNTDLARLARRPVAVSGPLLRDECLAIFTAWQARGRRVTY